MYIELNIGRLLKSPKLIIGHLKVDKFLKTLNSLRGSTNVVTKNIPIK
jgi:hypothetical protein